MEFKLPDMSCGHCASMVTQACKRVDPVAKVEVDLSSKKVKVESAEEPERFIEELKEAGYPPAS